MFFGLTNSPATFQRTINQMFREMKMHYPTELFIYMDDILITTCDNINQHWQITHEVLDKLQEESYFLQLAKCEFKKEKVDYLGVVISKERIHINPMKVKGLANWPRELHMIKQVRSTLGVLGYQRPFIPGFTHIARLLTNLLKKGTTFTWSKTHTKAINRLIIIVLSDPVLFRPDPKRPFILEVDASAFATGAILYQEHEETGPKHPVGYHSQTFNLAEQNYNVYNREFLAIIRGLENWWHLLVGSPHPIVVLMDHNNLQYYQHLQCINRRIAHYLLRMVDYNIRLKHQLGAMNKADHLSRWPDYDQGKDNNQNVMALLDHLFANVLNLTTLQEDVCQLQKDHPTILCMWKSEHGLNETNTRWYKDHWLVVMEDDILRRGVTHLIHSSNTTGHPGIAKTLTLMNQNYWWPKMKNFITEYIWGCVTCQSHKNITTWPKPPQFPIKTNPEAQPFEVIALDFITKLPPSEGYDSILTITNHDCLKGSIFIPCRESIDTIGVAELYATHVFPHYSLS